MIMREHDLPIAKQAEVLNVSRGSVYSCRGRCRRPTWRSCGISIGCIWSLSPFAGSRMLRGLLAAEGCKVGRRHVKTLMKRMGIAALYRHPRTTKPEPGHKVSVFAARNGGPA